MEETCRYLQQLLTNRPTAIGKMGALGAIAIAMLTAIAFIGMAYAINYHSK